MRFFMSFLLMLLCGVSEAGTNDFTNVKYIDAYDGDTFTVDLPDTHPIFGKKIPIRIKGIDAPEMTDKSKCGRPLALMSRCYLRQRLSAKGAIIDIRYPQRDKYFRLLGEVYLNGKSVADIMLSLDLAMTYDGKTKSDDGLCSLLAKAKTRPELSDCI